MYYLVKQDHLAKKNKFTIDDYIEDGCVYSLYYRDEYNSVYIGDVFQTEFSIVLELVDVFGEMVRLYYSFVTRLKSVISEDSSIEELIMRADGVSDVYIGNRIEAKNKYLQYCKKTTKAYLCSLGHFLTMITFCFEK